MGIRKLKKLWLQTSTLSSPSALTISGLNTITTTVVPLTRRKLRNSSRRPSPTCQAVKSSLMRTLRLASRNSTRTEVAPSRRSLACEPKNQIAENEGNYDFKAYSSTQLTSLVQPHPIPAVKESMGQRLYSLVSL